MLKESIEKVLSSCSFNLSPLTMLQTISADSLFFHRVEIKAPLYSEGTPALSKISMFLNDFQGLEKVLGSTEQLL